MPGRSGYESLSDNREGGRLKGWRGLVAFVGVMICLCGQVLSWTQTSEWCKMIGVASPCDNVGAHKAIQTAGTYLLFLLLLAGLNLYSYLSDRVDLRWCSAVLMFEVFDAVISDANRASDTGALFAAYILSLLGAAATFIVYPLDRNTFAQVGEDLKTHGYHRLVFALLVFCLATAGSIEIWGGSKDGNRDVHASASFVGLWYFMSVVTDSVPGQELAFIYMAIEIASYEPFTSSDDPNKHQTDDQIVGYALVFSAFLSACLYHLVIDCLGTNPKQWFSDRRSVGRMGLQLGCICLSLVGAIMVWCGVYDDGHHPWAHESWVVVTLLLVSLCMMLCELTQHPAVAIFSMCLMLSVIGDACQNINRNDGDTLIRIGYIFLFIGSGASFVSLPVDWNTNFSPGDAATLMESAETKSYVQSALAVFCAVLYLWSEQHYEGRLGFFSLIVMVAITHNFVEALQWVYVVALLFIPRLTPFTASFEMGGLASDVEKCALLVCFFSVLNVVYYHYTKFSFSAFTDVRLFTLRAGAGGEAVPVADGAATAEERRPINQSIRSSVADDEVPGAE